MAKGWKSKIFPNFNRDGRSTSVKPVEFSFFENTILWSSNNIKIKPLAQMVSSEANVMFKTQFDGNGSILAEIQAFEKT